MSDSASAGGHPRVSHVAGACRREQAQTASPLTYVTKDDVLLPAVHGSADRVSHFVQAIRFGAALEKTGVPATRPRSSPAGTATSTPSRNPG